MRVLIFASIVLAFGTIPSFAAADAACGGIAGAQCGEKEWCSYPEDSACGKADAAGVCKQRPEVCTMDYTPVCGCDGVTYTNACSAHASGTSVADVGACKDAGSQHNCAQVISCGTKDGVAKEYPTPCAAAQDGAVKISPKTGATCEIAQ